MVSRRVEHVVVHPDDKRGIGPRCRSGNDHSTSTGVEVKRCVLAGGKHTGRFDDQVNTKLVPRQVTWVSLCEY